MQHIFSLKKPYLGILVSVTLLFSLFFLAKSPIFNFNSSALVSALTLDFALTIPIVYFLLIRKSNIPKTTVVPLFIIGLMIASYSIPKEHQSLLSTIKTWVVPVLEILVFTFVFIKVRTLILQFRKNKTQSPDFFDTLKIATNQLLHKIPANLLAMEIAVFYYSFFKWKSPKLKQNEFTYHKNSGTPMLLGAFILIIAIETITIHFLAMQWNPVLAYALLVLSIYSGFQIFGFLKSLLFRPIQITKQEIHLKYGILAETILKVKNIDSIEYFTKDIDKEKEPLQIKLSPLGALESHNILISLKEEQTHNGLYGVKKQFQSIALYLDDKENFIQQIENLLTQD